MAGEGDVGRRGGAGDEGGLRMDVGEGRDQTVPPGRGGDSLGGVTVKEGVVSDWVGVSVGRLLVVVVRCWWGGMLLGGGGGERG